MNKQLLERLNFLEARLADVSQQLSNPEIMRDMNAFRNLSKEHSDLKCINDSFLSYKRAVTDKEEAESWLSDPELRELAREEIQRADLFCQELELTLRAALLPKDPNDERNIFLEIRAGTGGEEASLFVADLLRMYLRFAERQHWKTEIVNANSSDLGGYKEAIIRIIGQNVYSSLKFESGVHRVQRVPLTEAQGRVHTSACTVAVIPEADEIEAVSLNPADLRIDTFRASGAGGQHINKTDSAIRITHIPTGFVVECQDDRSQHRNKARAMSVLASRILEAQRQEQHQKEASYRKSLIGSGDRSQRIRTYNFPQGRLTDHRINLTLYKLELILDGDISEILNALSQAHQLELLEESIV